MFPLAQKHEKARQIWAEVWASATRDVDLVGGEGRRGGVVTCSSLFLCHIRLAGERGGEGAWSPAAASSSVISG
jgi:hypothetical protein